MGECLNCKNPTKILTKEKRDAKFCCHSCYLEYRANNKKQKQTRKRCFCHLCNRELVSTKIDAKICKDCKNKRKESLAKNCPLCGKSFVDNSRNKNKVYCGKGCNIKAGCLRYSEKVKSGYYGPPKSRDRKYTGRKDTMVTLTLSYLLF